MRFVLLSLVVLAFAFYELSGGADFVPRSDLRRADAVDTGADSDLTDSPAVAVTGLASAPTDGARPIQTGTSAARSQAMAIVDIPRPAPNAALLNAAAPSSLLSNGTALETPEVTLVSLEQNPSLFAASVSDAGADDANGGLTVSASLGAALASPVTAAPNPAAAPSAQATPVRDIRAVSGSRVNMRNGPGTNYSVLASLHRDAKVEVLADPGTGWVKLRPLAGGPVGWMADYLLTGANG